jgi:hypothetical protein
VRVHDDREAEVGRQALRDRAPRLAVVVAAQHADAGGAGPSHRPAAVVLHVEPAGRVLVAGDLVHALAELGVRIGHEAGADALVRGLERLPAVLAQVVAAGRDAEVHALPSRTIVCMHSRRCPGATCARARGC